MRELMITSRLGAEMRLTKPHGFTDFLSFSDSKSGPLECRRSVPHRLSLVFDDVLCDSEEYKAATPRDVSGIIEFAHSVTKDSRMLVHCAMGKRRSTAGAFIVLCVLFGPGHEKQALAKVLDVRKIAVPNERMVQLADDQLGRGGAMMRVVLAHNTPIYEAEKARVADLNARVETRLARANARLFSP